jgi:HK97 family phage portal protein
MNLPFGLQIGRRKTIPEGFQTLERSRGWWPIVQEGFVGAWQRNIVTSTESILTFAAVYACVTLKASDIAKLRIKLVERNAQGIWEEVDNPAYSPVLRKPNHFQTRIQFIEHWMASKFIHGNTYVLKQRDNRGGPGRGNVVALYVLDPTRVRVSVGPDGSVYYKISQDHLSKQEYAQTVPASEIIHDVMTPLYHPLCGVSPLTACALAAGQGLRIQNNSMSLFANGSMPSGILLMPDEIDASQAKEVQDRWNAEFGGNNVGRVAALGMGTKFEPIATTAIDAQLIDQLKWTSENVCTAHHVPPYMIGVGAMPTYNNIEALNQQYYSQALQSPIEALELLLDEGLEMGTKIGTELDLDGLLRMDTLNKMAAAEKAIKSGMSPDEVRHRFYDLGTVEGGSQPYLQQQNYSLEALAKRDSGDDPFGTAKPEPVAAPVAPPEPKPAVDKSILVTAFKSALKEAA